MKALTGRRVLVGLCVAVLLAGAAVAISRLSDRSAAETTTPQAAVPAPVVETSPPATTPAPSAAPELPKSQPIEPEVVRLLEAPLEEWVASWRAAAPEFDVRQLKKVMEGPLREDWLEFDMKWIDPQRRLLFVFSPDGTRFMDPYGGMELIERDGRLLAAFDIDGSITLYDVKASREMRLAFCGTTCALEDGIWLSNDLIAVVGSSEGWSCGGSDPSCSWVPMVMVFDFSRKIESMYLGPSIDSARRIPYFLHRLRQRLPEITFE